MPTKEEVAERLARAHLENEPGMLRVFRLLGSDEQEQRADEPIKLLEVNSTTIPSGIQPLYFGPHAPSGIVYPSIVIEVTPEEFDRITTGDLELPNGWRCTNEYTVPRAGGVPRHE